MSRLLWLAVPLCAAAFLLIALALCVILAQDALAHDGYGNVYEKNSDTGRLCCGGDPISGDCEGLNADQIHETKGGVFILSKRYSGQIFIPLARISWDVPRKRGSRGDYREMAFPNDPYEGHWCGKPRTEASGWPIDDDNPDPNYVTYCIFLRAGGV